MTALLACAAVAFAVYRDGQLSSARGEVADRRAELERLADDTLPAAVDRLREGASADTVLAELPRPSDEVHTRLLRLLVREISVGERQRAAAMSACANAAGRVQAMATSMLADLREMEHRHSEDVLGDLLSLDHSTAQAGRLADSIAVLTGARSGRRWTKPIVMESILRGAMGRIRAYQRVRLHSTSTSAIVGYAAEDVMHALAELMDNATKFSAPSEEVHVYVEQLHTGIVITVEDGGLGMKPQALERAERSVSSTVGLDLTKLSGSRLGLAVVGCLARKHKLQVYFRPSSRGGTGVVLRIPNHLVTQPRQEQVPAPSGQTTRNAASDSRTSRAEATVRDRSAVSGAPSATATLPGTRRPEGTSADTT
ncbi:sensor histidine kinase, partial [Saccharomonospora iraqiensis]|uniref:sensor histidine kinase n=1 Tax=Saccharomonospora iraqiensis TaxID=52698 RepID=UPI0039873EC6